MGEHEAELSGPDLRAGVAADEVGGGELLLGHGAAERAAEPGRASSPAA